MHEVDIEFRAILHDTVELPDDVDPDDADVRAVNRFLDDVIDEINTDPNAFVTIHETRLDEDNES